MKDKTGLVKVKGGKVWYEVIGEGKGTPLLLLHGGPGFTSYYLEPLKALGAEGSVIFYDQLGCGRSDRPDNKSLWKIERYVEEVASLVKHLNLDKVNLLGHSWGATLALEYATKYPEKVSSIIFASPYLSTPVWVKDASRLKKQLPKETQIAINVHEQTLTLSAPAYKKAIELYYKNHIFRKLPLPKVYLKSMQNAGNQVYLTMWGPTEFFVTGNLKDYDGREKLAKLNLPVLFTCGKYDEATPEACLEFQQLVKGSKVEVFAGSSHHPQLEEEEKYFNTTKKFLADVKQYS